tara:strand:- start:80 stop:208 length:129 start_codon:yes stop_codon:yes gene_type:complete
VIPERRKKKEERRKKKEERKNKDGDSDNGDVSAKKEKKFKKS